jgi:oxygen-independent coproporphyrinogen-3 oxidase
LTGLLEQVKRNFDCSRVFEITVEANPESLAVEKLAVLKQAGVTRLSMGVQSFSDRELQTLGRIHTAATAEQSFRNARKLRWDNINIDLIYGLPSQTLPAWQTNLEKALSLEPDHLSLYPLTIEPDTAFSRQGAVVNEEMQAEMYERSIDFLAMHGYEHYEISNWARPGYECRHNLRYWQNKEYIGIGVAAASYLNGRRTKNCSDLQKYCDLISNDLSAIEEEDIIDATKKLSEDMILKLRCRAGIAVSDEIHHKYGAVITKMTALDLLERNEGTIRLTRRGMLLANQVMKEFV